MKKAQSSLEFLSTYGWAVLAAVVVIGALGFFVAPELFFPTKVVMSDQRLQLHASGGNKIILSNVGDIVFKNLSFNITNYGCKQSPSIDLGPRDAHIFLMLCEDLPLNGKINAEFSFSYLSDQDVKKTIIGSLAERGKYFSTRGLVEYWPFDFDGNSYGDDILVGTLQAPLEEGVFNSGAEFNGVNTYVSSALPEIFEEPASQDFTIALWMNGHDLDQKTTWTRIMEARVNSTMFTQLVVQLIRRIEIVVWTNGERYAETTNMQLNEDEWYHVASTWSAVDRDLTLHINSRPQTFIGATGSGASGVDGSLNFGRRSDDRGHFDGMLDEVMVFNRVLAEEELSVLYYATRP